MNKMKCIIVDDEPVARKVLKEFIDQVAFLECVGQFENVLKTDLFLQNNKADIMFLDIEMPKRNGLDYLKSTEVKPSVILTTAFPEYALEGYELDIVDYLLKPIAFKRFLKAVQKTKEFIEHKSSRSSDRASYLFVRSEKRIERIELSDILYIEGAGNYVFIHTEKKKIIAYLTLKGIETQLSDQEFIKVHQSFLVSLSKINVIEGNVIKIGSKSVVISRGYKEAVMQFVGGHLLKRQSG